MPDPAQLLLAIVATAIVSAVGMLVVRGGRTASPTRSRVAGVLAFALGLAVGYSLLGVRPAWPPTSGLGRWLLIVLPIVVGIELLAAVEKMPGWLARLLRAGLAIVLVRILLHDSVYLAGGQPQWTAWQTLLISALVGTLLLAEWALLARVAEHEAAAAIPVAIAMASLCGGIAVMVAGYVTGGKAALPLAAALVGCATVSAVQGTIGIGVVGLFSLILVGRFFGGISTETALVVLLAPLMCYATELRGWRPRRPWLIGVVRLVLVALPLAMVLVGAKRDFDQRIRPLMPMRENGGKSMRSLAFNPKDLELVAGG